MPDVLRRDGRRPNYSPSWVRRMSDTEAAWCGAMIEAEGSVTFPRFSAHRAKVVVVNTDVEVISALLRCTGVGWVGPVSPAAQRSLGKKLCFVWSVQRWREVQAIARQCRPYSMKLQKVEV